MKSRRRIAFLKAQDCADFRVQQADYSRDLRPVKWVSESGLRGINPEPVMSALGQKRTSHDLRVMSALPSKADIAKHCWDVCFVPKADVSPVGHDSMPVPACPISNAASLGM